MAKKVERRFHVQITKNLDKGGAWLTRYKIYRLDEGTEFDYYEAHKNASAAKRWIKAKLIEVTGRKSIKLNVVKTDDAGKPTLIAGDVMYKVEP